MTGLAARLAYDGVLVAGIGCTDGATSTAILALIDAALNGVGAARTALVVITTTTRRRDHKGLRAAAQSFGVPLRMLDDAVLAAQAARLETPSRRVQEITGLGGIAEAAALTAGPLVLAKTVGEGVTCALAQVPSSFDPLGFGEPV